MREPPAGAAWPRCCNAPLLLLVSLTGVQPIPIDLETVTEARLVSEALAGSQSAFEQIVRRYQRPVISLIVRMVGDRGVAEELAQESFVKAFRNLRGFDVTRRLSSWLFRIAHNTALDWLRRARPAGGLAGRSGKTTPRTARWPRGAARSRSGRA